MLQTLLRSALAAECAMTDPAGSCKRQNNNDLSRAFEIAPNGNFKGARRHDL